MSKQLEGKLDKLKELVIDNLIEELEQGNTDNISVANTLLTSNKATFVKDDEQSQHQKVKRLKK